jgi:hypothetical protein
MRTRRIGKTSWIGLKDLPSALDAEARHWSATHRANIVVDMGDGDVVAFLWFGTSAKMKKVRQQLKALPATDLGLLGQRTSKQRMSAALQKRSTAPLKSKRRSKK